MGSCFSLCLDERCFGSRKRQVRPQTLVELALGRSPGELGSSFPSPLSAVSIQRDCELIQSEAAKGWLENDPNRIPEDPAKNDVTDSGLAVWDYATYQQREGSTVCKVSFKVFVFSKFYPFSLYGDFSLDAGSAVIDPILSGGLNFVIVDSRDIVCSIVWSKDA